MRNLYFTKKIFYFLLLFGIGLESWGQVNEGFESSSPPPSGWTYTSVTHGTNNPRNGSRCATFNANNDEIISPLISNPNQLSFWWRRSSTSPGSPIFQVFRGTSTSGPWTQLASDITSFTTTYQEFTFSLSSFSNIYIRILHTRTSGGNEVYIDDFLVTSTTSSCTPPTVSATGLNTTVTTNTINLAWTNPVSGADGVVVVARSVSGVNQNPVSGTAYAQSAVYGSGASLTNGNFVVYTGTGNNVSITGLNASTAYHFSIYTYTNTGLCYNTTNVLTGNATTSSLCAAVLGPTSLLGIQDFEASPANPTWTISSGGSNSSTNSGSGDTPSNQRILAGSRSWQVNNGTATLELNNISVSGYGNVRIIGRVTSTSATTGNGAEAADYIRIFTSLNNNAFLSDLETNADLVIKGFGSDNARWGYNAALTATGVSGGNSIYSSPQTGTSTNNYSTFVISIPEGTQTVSLRIVASNDNGNEIWNIDNISIVGNAILSTSNYYYTSGSITSLSSWWSNPDGTGINPNSFTCDGQILNVRSSTTLGANWVVSGVGSKIILGNSSIAGISLTIPSGFSLTGTIDVAASSSGGNSIVIQNSSFPTLGTLDNTSTIVYAQGGSFTPSARAYGNIILDNTSLTNPSSSTDWQLAGSITLRNGAFFNAPNLGINTTGIQNQSLTGGNFAIRSFDNTLKTNGNLILGNNLNLTIGSPGSGAFRGTFTGIGNQFIDNGSIITIGNNLRMGGNKAGYNLTGTIILTNNSGNTNITGDEDNNTAIAAELNNLVSNVSSTATTSFRPNSGINSIIIKGNLSISGLGTGTVFFNQNNISIGGSFFYDRTSDNIDEGASSLIFYGSGVQTITSNVTGGLTLYNLVLDKNGSIIQNTNISVTSILGIKSGIWDTQANNLSGSANAILSMTGGSLRLARTGITLPDFPRAGNDAYKITGGTIELYGNGFQTLRGARDYATLVISSNSNTSITSAITSVAGISITGNAVFNTDNNTFGSTSTNLTMSGNGRLIVAGSGTKPDMNGSYFLGDNSTIEFSGNTNTTVRTLNISNQNGGRFQNIAFSGDGGTKILPTQLNVLGNFTNNISGGASLLTTLNSVNFTGGNQTILGSAITDFYKINLSGSGTKTFQDSVRVLHTLSVLSPINIAITDKPLTLVSDANYTARIGTMPNGSTITGSVNMQRFVPAKNSYRLYSSAVKNASLSNLKNDIFLVSIANTTVNGFDFRSAGAFPSIVWYVETVAGSLDVGWRFPSTISSKLVEGRGYMLFVKGSRADNINSSNSSAISASGSNVTLNRIGNPNQGEIDLNVSFTSSAGTTADGWNLVGNPYPCEIDWNSSTGWTKSGIESAIYYFDPKTSNTTLTGTLGNYISCVAGVSSDGRTNCNIIPSSQGFWVKANAALPELKVNEAAKTSEQHLANFRKEYMSKYFVVAMFDSKNSDKSVVRLLPNISNAFQSSEEARKMTNSGLSLFTINEDSQHLSINAVSEKEEHLLIPLGFSGHVNGNASIGLENVSTVSSQYEIYLIDNYKNDTVLITKDTAYNFVISSDKKTFETGRITILLKFANQTHQNILTPNDTIVNANDTEKIAQIAQKDSVTSVNNIQKSLFKNLKIYPNPHTETGFYIENSTKSSYRLFIYNSLGQLMSLQNVVEGSPIHYVETEKFTKGVYFMKVLKEGNKEELFFTIVKN